MGALRPEKNVARMIRAFAKQPHDARLVIYGDGPERENLATLAATLGERVIFKGQTTEPERGFAEFDVFCLSSDTEQMPLSLMEAMAAGLPVVATDVGDVKEMVSEENGPYIFQVGDEAGFSAAMAQMASDAAVRKRLGAANAEKARAEFDIARMVRAHGALYRSMVAKARL
jgi:glycosyltransferase involved in cell wall biosynthesis